jgi:fused signal recognition particle receptor
LSRLVRAADRGDVNVEQIEEALLLTDLGPKLSAVVAESVRVRLGQSSGGQTLLQALRAELLSLVPPLSAVALARPLHTVLVVGVNGSGKTTTVAKLAARHRSEGARVMVAAGDTFRAAAAEQLEILLQRSGARVIKQRPGADPASVVYDCLSAARARHAEVVLVDTGGRLQTRADLMEELVKIKRVMGKMVEGAPHEVYLVLDGTTGQNALSQAREFHQKLGLTGIIVAKLDGTAKGGAVLAVGEALGIGVRYLGVGEGLEDIEPFDAGAFVEAMVEDAG